MKSMNNYNSYENILAPSNQIYENTSTLLQKVKKMNPELTELMNAIQTSCKMIQHEISRAGISGSLGSISDDCENASGDVQNKLDVISNEIMINNLIHSRSCAVLLSEENTDEIFVPKILRGGYIVAFDPLDGSSNIDCNVCVGTIFIVCELMGDINDWRDCIDGDNIICAGYCLYGPSTELIVTIGHGNGVFKFTLDNSINEFVYTGDIHIPKEGEGKKIYSVNESNCENWDENVKEYISLYKIKNTKYTQRYIGSMVADVHRTLLYGGMFMYPSDNKNVDGKLRVLYECYPMAKITEEAGGLAITTKKYPIRILDIKTTDIHQRTSILLGSKEEIKKFNL